MTKLTYEDKVNIYNDRKIGLSIKSIANKYSIYVMFSRKTWYRYFKKRKK